MKDVEQTVKTVEKVMRNIDEGKAKCYMFFVSRNVSKKKNSIGELSYKPYLLTFSDGALEYIAHNMLENVVIEQFTAPKGSNHQSDGKCPMYRDISEYNCDITGDEVGIIALSDVPNATTILNAFSPVVNESCDFLRLEKTDNINFVVTAVFTEGVKIFLFKKYSPTQAFRKKIVIRLDGTTSVEQIKKPYISIDTDCDALLIDEVFFTFSHRSFESIFNFLESYSAFVGDNKEVVLSSKILDNPQALLDHCAKNQRHLKRLVKAIKQDAFSGLDLNRDKVEQVIQDYSLSVRVENDVIIFDEKNVSEILKIILREYVVDPISDNNMVASGISDYRPGGVK